MDYTINIRGRLLSLAEPQVMGIVNITPNSFYAASRVQTEEAVRERVKQMEREGATMIDVGACSTNPYLDHLATEDEEMRQLAMGLGVIREMGCELPVSVDTFRAGVARRCIEEFGADIINDVSAGADPDMFGVVAGHGTPYVLMSRKSTLREVMLEFSGKVQQLYDLGQKDIILDPGFGFGKTAAQNFSIYNEMERFDVMELPLLVGISRKRMVYQTLGITPDESLNGTTVLNTMALMKGASILRVHDVKEAVQAVTLYKQMISSEGEA